MTSTPEHDEQNTDARKPKPLRGEVWTLAVGVLILLGLFGHLLNQQRASRRTPGIGVASLRQQSSPALSVPETKTQTVQPSPTPRQRAENRADTRKPSPVTYVVTHKHRFRDCRGTLTFTRAALRFESDEPRDAFAVGVDDVTVEGDAVRIREQTWRFAFHDAVPAAHIFRDWKTGTLFKR